MVARYGQGVVRNALLLALAALISLSVGDGDSPSDVKEREELEEIKDVQEEGEDAETSREMMWSNFKTIVDSYIAENKRLVEQNYLISRDVDDGRIGVKQSDPILYEKIPHFKFLTAAEPAEGELTQDGCQVKCNQDFNCHSFSWNKETQECYTSVKTLRYDPTAVMYLKKEKGEGDPSDNYQQIPGLVGDGIPTGGSAPKKSVAECSVECTKGPYCKSFIYFQKAQQCVPAGDGAEFDEDWVFFEKQFSKKDKLEHAHRSKENAFKETLRKEWAVQNQAEVARENVQKKEMKTKCNVNDIQHLQLKEKNAAEDLADAEKRMNDLKGKISAHRRQAQINTEGYLRMKTAELKFKVQKETKFKEAAKMVHRKRIEEAYSKMEEMRIQAEKTAEERETFQAEMNNDKMQTIRYFEQQKDLHTTLTTKREEKGVLSAQVILAQASHQALCGEQQLESLKADLNEEKKASSQARQLATEAERRALSLQQTSEKANKAMVAAKAGADGDELEKAAHKAAKDAQDATAEAKSDSKQQLTETTKMDELKMEVARGAGKQKTLQEKAVAAQAFLDQVKLRKKRALEAELRAEDDTGKTPQ